MVARNNEQTGLSFDQDAEASTELGEEMLRVHWTGVSI